jgi:P27 family predicted phage terminase small subunit
MLELRQVSKVYGQGAAEVHALREVSLDVGPGLMVAVMGPSGSGKSTLLTIAGSLEEPASGQVDQDMMVSLVRAVCRHEDAARLVAAEGIVVTGKDGQRVRHPAVIIEREAAETVRRLAREFGLTPSGRADLGHAPPAVRIATRTWKEIERLTRSNVGCGPRRKAGCDSNQRRS